MQIQDEIEMIVGEYTVINSVKFAKDRQKHITYYLKVNWNNITDIMFLIWAMIADRLSLTM